MTHSGIYNFLMKVRNLSWIERCSNTLHIKPYSVAEHSFFLTFYAMTIADLEETFSGKKIYNMELLLKKAVIHDIEESITGDILYPIKNVNPETSNLLKRAIKVSVNSDLFNGLPEIITKKYIDLWSKSKDETPEGILVAAIDKLELLLYAATELLLGNFAMKNIYKTAFLIIKEEFNSIRTINLLLEEMDSVINNSITESKINQ